MPNWKDIDPRFGVAYDLFGDGKTAIKASVGRYVVGESYTIARAVNPVQSTVNTIDAHVGPASPTGTYNPFNDCDLSEPGGQQQACRARWRAARSATRSSARSRPDDQLRPGDRQGLARAAEQLGDAVSIQREMLPRVSVYAGYTRRWFGNLFATRI